MPAGSATKAGAGYLAPFHVLESSEFRPPARETAAYQELRVAIERGEWAYDPSDDPSFFCARFFADEGGALSWGICRPDLREQLRVGDTVAFFPVSSRRRNATYRFAGYATVEEKVSQDQIWSEDRLAVYQKYLNLLVEPLGDGVFIHRENHPGGPHPDWLFRLVGRRGYSWRARDFGPWTDHGYSKTVRPGVDETAGRQPIHFARNYVIFERDAPGTFIAADPPVIATSPGGREPETWGTDEFATALRELTVGGTGRTLRTTAPRNQHPFTRLDMDARAWRPRLLELMQAAGIEPV
jgi:hypothetical protein